MYIVTYKGKFAFIKPWTAVRDGETFSQQFLTPSIIEGIEKKLFPELLSNSGICKILRHKLHFSAMSSQQEVTQTRGWRHTKDKANIRERSVLKRSILINPILYIAFEREKDAIVASKQHICLCRNEDILLPEPQILNLTDDEFTSIPGFEFVFDKADEYLLVGFNRYNNKEPMYGHLEYNGQSLL